MKTFVVPGDWRSWVPVAPESHFPIQNLPYGIFSTRDGRPARVGVAIGEFILDTGLLHDAGLLDGPDVFRADTLNPLMSLGRGAWTALRQRLAELLRDSEPVLRDDERLRARVLVPMADATLHMPVHIGAFVDFYSSEQHASNVGRMFRDPERPLLPNWKHLPVGYNGRASSVVGSGTDVIRPCGQTVTSNDGPPSFGPSKQLDFELEVGFFTGADNPLGDTVAEDQVDDFVFGLVLVNDWSARDVQRWEYAPLGPFLAKSFATSISPWVVPVDALLPFRVPGPEQDPTPLPHLQTALPWHFDVQLEVAIQTERATKPQRVCRTNFRHMYWSLAQQLLHQASNGTNVQVGDLYASGTISGPDPDSYGSMLELAWRGERPIAIEETGETRVFIHDGDRVLMSGWAQGAGFRVGFGELCNRVAPARVR